MACVEVGRLDEHGEDGLRTRGRKLLSKVPKLETVHKGLDITVTGIHITIDYLHRFQYVIMGYLCYL